MTNRFFTISILLAIFVCVAVVFLLCFIIGARIPPYNLTLTRMTVLEWRVINYLQIHDELPKNVDDLPKREGYDNNIKDGWGRNIQIDKTNDSITLKSYGRDGQKGGEGQDADIELKRELDELKGAGRKRRLKSAESRE